MNLIFCLHCRSNSVDVYAWDNGAALFKCANCGNAQQIRGFSVGRVISDDDYSKEIELAKSDIAIKIPRGAVEEFKKKIKSAQRHFLNS